MYAFQEYATRRDSSLQTFTKVKSIIDLIDDHIQIDIKLIKEDPIARMTADGELSKYGRLNQKNVNPSVGEEDYEY